MSKKAFEKIAAGLNDAISMAREEFQPDRMNLSNFCKTYPNSLSNDDCDEIIAMYKNFPNLHHRYDDNGFPNMSQMNFTMNREIHEELHNYLCNNALKYIDMYSKEVKESKFWPKKFSFEQFRIKHYKAGGHDRFDEHIDSKTLESAKRYLIFFWYLNDVEEGGETEITNINLKVKPEKGKLLIFPPFWMFPHIGHPVIKGEKYLLSSYMHYNENSV